MSKRREHIKWSSLFEKAHLGLISPGLTLFSWAKKRQYHFKLSRMQILPVVELHYMLKVYYLEPHEEQEDPEWGCEPAQWLHQDWQEEVHLRYPHFSVDKSQINSPEQLSTVLKWNYFVWFKYFQALTRSWPVTKMHLAQTVVWR